MPVVAMNVPADDLQGNIQTQKDLGRKILSIGISKFEKASTRSLEYKVTEYVVVVQ